MVGREAPKLRSQFGTTKGHNLIGMHLEGEAHSASRIEQATSLLVVEDSLFCKYVAALGKPSALNLGEYRLYQILDVVRGATF